MKILYALQGTGNGHVSRARQILPLLERYCQFDVLISGHNCDLGLPFPVKYRPNGISMAYDDHGGVSLRKSWTKLKSRTFLKEVMELPVCDYDLVISDFEPVSAYAALMRGVPSYALSHQAAFLSSKTPRPGSRSLMAEAILRWFAPCGQSLGFHFQPFDDFIFGPVIRDEVRELNVRNNGHVSVYLPSFRTEVLTALFQQVPEVEWHIFARGIASPAVEQNCFVMPVSEINFLKSLGSCDAVLCGAGFELPSEALFLGKKLAVIPIRGQYEQQCNAAALTAMGIASYSDLPDSAELSNFLNTDRPEVSIHPANVNRCLDFIFEDFALRAGRKARKAENFLPSFR